MQQTTALDKTLETVPSIFLINHGPYYDVIKAEIHPLSAAKSMCWGSLCLCYPKQKGRGEGWRTALFLAIESCYFSQDGRKTLTFLLFVLISFVQGVASDLRKWAGSILAGTV